MLDLVTLLRHDLGLIKYSRSGTYYFQIRSCLETQGLGLQHTILAGSNSNRLKQFMLLTHMSSPQVDWKLGCPWSCDHRGPMAVGKGRVAPALVLESALCLVAWADTWFPHLAK